MTAPSPTLCFNAGELVAPQDGYFDTAPAPELVFRYADGGRKAAGRKGHTGDCGTRALSLLLGWCEHNPFRKTGVPEDCVASDTYLGVYKLLAAENKAFAQKKMAKGEASFRKHARNSASNGVYDWPWRIVAQALGLEKVVLPKGARPTFAQAFEAYGPMIASMRRHWTTVIDGEVLDTWDTRFTYYDEATGRWHYHAESCIAPVQHDRKAKVVWVPGETLS